MRNFGLKSFIFSTVLVAVFCLAIFWQVQAQSGEPAHPEQPEPVKVAIVDSGFGTNSNLFPYEPGYNAVDGSDSTVDQIGHGTNVGNVAYRSANDNDAYVKMYPVKVYEGGDYIDDAAIVRAIDWAIANDMDVINMSFAGGYSSEVEDAIKRAEAKGIIMVSTTGNIPNASAGYPAALDNVIGVGSTGLNEKPTSYTSGQYGDQLDFLAPGSVPNEYDGYGSVAGTSYSAPYVTGVVASIKNSPIESDYDFNGDGKWDSDEIVAKMNAEDTSYENIISMPAARDRALAANGYVAEDYYYDSAQQMYIDKNGGAPIRLQSLDLSEVEDETERDIFIAERVISLEEEGYTLSDDGQYYINEETGDAISVEAVETDEFGDFYEAKILGATDESEAGEWCYVTDSFRSCEFASEDDCLEFKQNASSSGSCVLAFSLADLGESSEGGSPLAPAQVKGIVLEKPSWEGLIPCGRYYEKCDQQTDGSCNWVEYGADAPEAQPCSLCHLVIGIWRIIQYGQWILVTVAVVAIVIGGVIYIISSGNEGLATLAKKTISSALIGFAIVLGSWLIINVLINWVLDARNLGMENQITDEGEVIWNKFRCVSVPAGTTGTTGTTGGTGTQPGTSTTPDTSGYTYDSGISNQLPDASGALASLLDCMKDKLPEEAKRISSISDSQGMDNCTGASYSRPPCAHTQYSCHYGGRNCIGESYAVDFGNENYYSQIDSAAKSCVSGAYVLNEGNHIHVSIGNVNGCNCDAY